MTRSDTPYARYAILLEDMKKPKKAGVVAEMVGVLNRISRHLKTNDRDCIYNTFAKSHTKMVFINLKYRKWVKLIIFLSPIHVPQMESVAIHI